MIKDFELQLEHKKLTIEYDNRLIEAKSSTVMADPIAVTQVFENLLSNAIKFSPVGSTIHIIVEDSRTNMMRVIFQDEGEGIRADELPSLFSRYARISPQPTAGEDSTGLGLFIVKRLVEAMQGRVWCESTVDIGTSFFVEFQYTVPLLAKSHIGQNES
jgi:signal transduction histidine kinase